MLANTFCWMVVSILVMATFLYFEFRYQFYLKLKTYVALAIQLVLWLTLFFIVLQGHSLLSQYMVIYFVALLVAGIAINVLFYLGLAGFLVSHIVAILAFFVICPAITLTNVGWLVVLLLLAFLIYYIMFNGKIKMPEALGVVFYLLVSIVAIWRAIIVITVHPLSGAFLAVGYIAFFISDVQLAYGTYVKTTDYDIAVNSAIYYPALLLLALSATF